METVFYANELIQHGYTLSTDNSLVDINVLYNYLANESYWAKGISIEQVRISVNNSLCFGIYKENEMCAFARVVTDKAIFAYICDVFVSQEHRGRGLSKWMMHSITQHNELRGLRRWMLATADAHGLYRQFGFIPLSHTDRWMEIFTPHATPPAP